MNYSILPENLNFVANASKEMLEDRFHIKKVHVEEEVEKNILWRPTLLWKTKLEYIACEVNNRPFPKSIYEIYTEVINSGLPIRVYVAFPENNGLTSAEYQREINKLKKCGIGCISINEDLEGEFLLMGIPLALHITNLDYDDIKKSLRPKIKSAYEVYLSSPKHGVQELGQIIEEYMFDLAKQAKSKEQLSSSGYVPGENYRLTKLMNELLKDETIDLGILGKCRAYVYPRNDTSHPPKNIQEAKRISKKLKENFTTGVSILEELPKRFKEKGFRFK